MNAAREPERSGASLDPDGAPPVRGPSGAARRKARASIAAAVAAICAAGLAAYGPAHRHHTSVVWPAGAATAAPARMIVAPLLLSRRHAAAIDVNLACRLPPPLAGVPPHANRLVLATTRDPSAGGLRLLLAERRLIFESGDRVVRLFPWPPRAAAGGRCGAVLRLDLAHWSYADATGKTIAAGDLSAAPTVNGLFTTLDLRRADISVRLTTEIYGATPTLVQRVAGMLAIVLSALAIALATSFARRSRGGRVGPTDAAVGRRRIRLVDGAVVAALGVWWIVGPAFVDDGWARARQQNYAAAGSFIEYFAGWGGILPGEYWLDWLEHWLVRSTGSVPLLRLVPLVAGIAGWVVCRRAFARATGERPPRLVALWTMGVVYLVAFFAWGMTLRPEPVVAVLAAGSLLGVLYFLERPSVGPLAVVGVLTALALTAHPTGIVALAPPLAAGPSILRWARGGGRTLWLRLSAVFLAAAAQTAVLFFVEADFGLMRQQTALARTVNVHNGNWRDELDRYTLLSTDNFGTPLRRLAVAFLLVAVVAFLTRSRRKRLAATDLPALTVVLALLLLAVTPSKWPWHFGALVGIGAVALATEVHRLAGEGDERSRSIGLRPLGAIVLVLAANAWAWGPLAPWNALDLRTLRWSTTAGSLVHAGSHVTPGSMKQWPLVLAVAVLAVAVWGRWRRGRWEGSGALWSAALWVVVIVAAPTLAYTAGYFVRDTQLTDGWTLLRQNLDSLRGTTTCGLGDALTVPQPGSIRALAALPAPTAASGRPALVPDGVPLRGSRPPFGHPPVWGSWGASASSGAFVSPWFAVPPARTSQGVGIFVSGSPARQGLLSLEWGVRTATSVDPVERGEANLKPKLNRSNLPEQNWRLVPARLLPIRPARADAIRIVAVRRGTSAGWFAVSAPVEYRRETVASVIRADPSRVLITAALELYFPCASRPPVVAHGVAAVPGMFVSLARRPWPLDDPTSPFAGVTDVVGVASLPLDGSRWNPNDVVVYAALPPRMGESTSPVGLS